MGQGGAAGGQSWGLRGGRTWPQAEGPGHQEAPGQVHGPRGAAAGPGAERRRGAASQSGSLLCAAPRACTARGARFPDSRGSFRGSGRAGAAGRGAGTPRGSGRGPVSAPLPPGQAAGCGLDASLDFSFCPQPTPAVGDNSREPRSWEPPRQCPASHSTATEFRVCSGKVTYSPTSQRKELQKAQRVPQVT